MRKHLTHFLCLASLLGSFSFWSTPAHAQKSVADRLTTELQFDLLLPRERPNGVAAQQWGEVFAKMNVPLRIRQPAHNDKEGVDQQVFGTIRRVKVIGQLDRSGQIVFPDRKFHARDVAKLEEWIEELRTYGAQGAPEGQPLWGLQQAEFDRLYLKLKEPVEESTAGMSMTAAIRVLGLPEEYPLRFTADTRELLSTQPLLPDVQHDLQGFAKGTSLAIILRGYGLSVAPRRLPDESIVLAIEPDHEERQAWPIGWNPDQLGLPRMGLAKEMFAARSIHIDKQILSELLPHIEEETGMKIFLDPLSLESLKVNPERLVINYPHRRTSWSLCLRTILGQVKLTQEVRVDENEKPFLWVSRFVPRNIDKSGR